MQTLSARAESLGLALLADLPGNAALSPASLVAALSVAAEGARDETLSGLRAALGEDLATAIASLRAPLAVYDALPQTLDPHQPPPKPLVHQGVQVVVVGGEADPAFVNAARDRHGAEITLATVDDAQSILDGWVRRHTAGLVERSAAQVDGQLVAVIQDALLFAASWLHPFTLEDVLYFKPSGGTTRAVPAMWGTVSAANATTDAWRAVRLPYDDALAMDVIVPSDGLSTLDGDVLRDVSVALDAAPTLRGRVGIPPADLTTSADLTAPLRRLGIDLANLGGIAAQAGGSAPNTLVHQARLVVSPRGTVGAAVTEVVARSGPGPAQGFTFMADRPYLMRVLDTRTGWPLFLATVHDPG